MTSKLKCPFCRQELEIGGVDGILRGCPKCRNLGTEILWQELIRTGDELEQNKTCCSDWEKQALDYKAKDIALSGELERTRKALEIAIKYIKYTQKVSPFLNPVWFNRLATEALDKITAIEQKD